MSTEREMFGLKLLKAWEGVYGTEGIALIRGFEQPTEEQQEAMRAAIQPVMGNATWGATLWVGPMQDADSFDTPQRSWPKADPSDMDPDPAYVAEAEGLAGKHDIETVRRIGAWRWPLVFRHREWLAQIIQQGRAVDFGGLAGPIGYGAVVVDHGAEHRALYDVPGKIDVFFSSHTLEHIRDLDTLLVSVEAKLNKGGFFVANVPSWRFEKLRAGNWPHHYQTFHGGDGPAEYTDLAAAIRPWADVFCAEDDRDCLFVAGRKR